MRKVLLALATSAVVFTGGMSAAAARDYPYCIQGEDYAGGAGECGFTTIAQCQATASGRLAYCAANPTFAASAQVTDRSRPHHHPN
jgi:hypothetical protein